MAKKSGKPKKRGHRQAPSPSKSPLKKPRLKVLDASTPPTPSAKRRPQKSTDGERLQKFLAAAGVASRRQCESMILEGRVSVNGQMVLKLGSKVQAGDDVRVDGARVRSDQKIYLKINKPKGYLSTTDDPQTRKIVLDLVPSKVKERLHIMGRLDEESEGLMILSNDGSLTSQITHPRYGVLKEYECSFHQNVKNELLNKARAGLWLSDGKTKPMGIQVIKRTKMRTLLRVTLAEGRNRVIRRVFAKLGCHIVKLKRVSIGPVRLGRLKVGDCQALSSREKDALLSLGGNKTASKTKTHKKTAPKSKKTTKRNSRKAQAPKKGKRS